MNNLNDLWIKIKEELRNEVSESVFDDYFLNINEIYKEQNNNLYLVVENSFYKKKIQNQYLDKLNYLLQLYETDKRFYLITKEEAQKEESTKKDTKIPFKVKNNASGLNPNYTFSTYMVGDSNRMAHRYAVLVSEQRADLANPVYIFGGVGLGKTHLMQAIGNAIAENDPNAKILYTSAQDFCDEYVRCVGKEGYTKFAQKFDVDVLLVDDIQIIENKDQTQIEFFKIFERLSNKNKLIILTSDKKPADLTNIMTRLTSRFEKGLSFDISKPNKELRIKILNSKIKQELPNPETVPSEVVDYLATVCDRDVRQLEGCLKRVLLDCELFEKDFTIENAKESLKNMLDFTSQVSSSASNDDIKRLISIVCGYFKVSESDLLSQSRKKEIVYARQITWYILKEKYDLTFKKIGLLFGGKDHSTIMHGCGIISDSVKSSKETQKNLENIQRKMGKDTNIV